MNASTQFYLSTAIKPGSSFYYSLLPVYDPLQHQALAGIQAFWREINAIFLECSDPGVARAKFYWWQQECERFYKHEAQHPLMQSLYSIVDTFNLDQHLFNEIIEGALTPLNHSQFAERAQLEKFCLNTYGKITQLRSKILGLDFNTARDFFEKISLSIYSQFLFNHARAYLAKQFLFIPLAELDALHLTPNDLHPSAQFKLLPLWQEQYKFIQTYFNQAIANRPLPLRQSRSFIIYAKLKLATLEELKKADFPHLSQRIQLTPLRKWWKAWRTG